MVTHLRQSDLAHRLGKQRSDVGYYRDRGYLPHPDGFMPATHDGGEPVPIWEVATIERWEKNGGLAAHLSPVTN